MNPVRKLFAFAIVALSLLLVWFSPHFVCAQTDPVIRPIEITNKLCSTPGWFASRDLRAAPWKSGFIFRIGNYKACLDASGPAPWPFPATKVSVGNQQFDFFEYSDLEDVQGFFYAFFPLENEPVLAKYQISSGVVQQQQLDVKGDLEVSCFDHARNRIFLQDEKREVYYAVDLHTLTVVQKIPAWRFGISKSGRYICHYNKKYHELDPVSFKRMNEMAYDGAENRDLAPLDFFIYDSRSDYGTYFIESNQLLNYYTTNELLYSEENKQLYEIHDRVGWSYPEEKDTLYYVNKVELSTRVSTRVYEAEHKIEHALLCEDNKTLVVFVNKDKPTKQLQERPAKLQKLADERRAIEVKLADERRAMEVKVTADSLEHVRSQDQLAAVAEARLKAVEDSIRWANFEKERKERYKAEELAKRLAEEKRIADQNMLIREKFELKVSMRDQPLERISGDQPTFSDRGLGVYSGFKCADKNDSSFYYIFDKEFFTVYDSLTASVKSYRYPYACANGRRDIRHYYTGYFLLFDHELGHVYIIDAYRGIIKARYEMQKPVLPVREFSIIPGKGGVLFLNHITFEQAFYSQRKDSLCFESCGVIDSKKFSSAGILKSSLFPDYSHNHLLDRNAEDVEQLISEGFTFIYNYGNSRVFSVKQNDFEELDPYERTRLKADVRFEGYNGRLFGYNGYDYSTTWIDRDNIPESYVRERKDGIGFKDRYEEGNDLLLIYVKWTYTGHCFYALNGQIVESSSQEVKYLRMKNTALINHGMTPGNWARLVVVRDSLGRPWLLKMNHLKVFNAHLLVNGQKASLNEAERNALFGEVIQEELTDLRGQSSDDLRDQYVEAPKPKASDVPAVDPNKIFESTAKMVGFSDTGMRIELQVRVWYKVKIEKGLVFGGTQHNRYPEAYETINYRIPANSDKWFSCPSEITTCGVDNGTTTAPVTCIVIGGVAYRLYNPEYYD
jgi:hypothetical protein